VSGGDGARDIIDVVGNQRRPGRDKELRCWERRCTVSRKRLRTLVPRCSRPCRPVPCAPFFRLFFPPSPTPPPNGPTPGAAVYGRHRRAAKVSQIRRPKKVAIRRNCPTAFPNINPDARRPPPALHYHRFGHSFRVFREDCELLADIVKVGWAKSDVDYHHLNEGF